MASDPPNTGAAFTYSLELDVIKIEDLYTGTKRVADDIKSVLRKIESWHQGPIIGYLIMYLESNGLWTGVDWDGKSVGFFALGETDESGATFAWHTCIIRNAANPIDSPELGVIR